MVAAAAVLPVPDVGASALPRGSASLPAAVSPYDPTALRDRAHTLRLNGKYAEARALYEQLVAMAEAEHGLEHSKIGVALNDLAQVLFFLGDFPWARSTAERALKISEAALGPDHLEVAYSLFSLARVLTEQNELDAAQ